MAGDLNIKIDLETSQAETQIKELERLWTNSNRAIARQKIELERLTNELDKLKSKAAEELKIAPDLDRKVEVAKSFREAFIGLKTDINLANKALDETSQKAGFYGQKLKEAVIETQRGAAGLTIMNQKAKELGKSFESSKTSADRLGSSINNAGNSTEVLSGKTLNAGQKIINGFEIVGQSIQGFGKKILGLSATVFVFSLIRKGLSRVRDAIIDYISVDSEMKASLAKLRGAWLTAFQPIWELIVPFLRKLVEWLAKAAGAVAAFINGLMGKSTEQSRQNAAAIQQQIKDSKTHIKITNKRNKANQKALDKQKKAVKDIAKKQKELRHDVAKFDELNILSKKNAKGTDNLNKLKNNFNDLKNPMKDVATDLGNVDIVIKDVNDSVGDLNKNLKDLDFTSPISEETENKWQNFGERLKKDPVGTVVTAYNNFMGSVTESAFGEGALKDPNFLRHHPYVQLSDPEGIKERAENIKKALQSAFEKVKEVYETLKNNLKQNHPELYKMLYGDDGDTSGGGSIGVRGKNPNEAKTLGDLMDEITKAWDEWSPKFKKAWDEYWENIPKAWDKISTWWNTNVADPVSKKAEEIKNSISNGFQKAKEKAWEAWNNTKTWFGEKLKGAGEAAENIKGTIATKFEEAKSKVKEVWSNAKTWFGNKLEEAGTAAENVKDTIVTKFQEAKDSIISLFSNAGDFLKPFANGVLFNIERLVNRIISAWNQLSIKLSSWGFTMPDWLGGGRVSFNLPRFDYVNIPRLATGAVIPPNNPYLAMVGDQRSGTNIEAPLDTIKQALIEALQESGGAGGNGSYTFVAQLDGRTLFEETVRQNDMYINQAGYSAFA